MESQLFQTLNRVENKLDALTEKLNSYSLECSTERTAFNGRIQTLEDSYKNIRGRFYNILEKLVIWGVASYFSVKELSAHF